MRSISAFILIVFIVCIALIVVFVLWHKNVKEYLDSINKPFEPEPKHYEPKQTGTFYFHSNREDGDGK